MPKSSRHRSHRSHKHSRDRSESEEEGNERVSKEIDSERRRVSSRLVEENERVSKEIDSERRRVSSRLVEENDRVLKEVDSERRRVSSRLVEEKDVLVISNGEVSEEHGKKRRESSRGSDRGNVCEEDYKRNKVDDGESLEKGSKSKFVGSDSKVRYINDESVGRSELSKERLEKDAGRRESNGDRYRDRDIDHGAERERRKERDREREKHGEREKDRNRDRDIEREKHGEREKERNREWEKYGEREKDRNRYKDIEREKDRNRDDDIEREKDRNRDKDREREKEKKDMDRERERERKREREREKEMGTCHDSQERPDDLRSSKNDYKRNIYDVQRSSTKVIDRQVEDVLPNSELEKLIDKHTRKDDYNDNKQIEEGGDKDESKLHSRKFHVKNRTYRDEMHEDGSHRQDVDIHDSFRKHRDDKQREDHSRDRASYRSDNHLREERKPGDFLYRKKVEEDNDGTPYSDDHDSRLKDNYVKKRVSDENEDVRDRRSQSAKELREDVDEHAVDRINTNSDQPRQDLQHSNKFDSNPRNIRHRSSVKEHSRDSSRQAEHVHKESPSDNRRHNNSASAGGCFPVSEISGQVATTTQDKTKLADYIYSGERLNNKASPTKYDRTTRSYAHPSSNQSKRKSPSNSDHRFSDRADRRRSLNDLAHKSSDFIDEELGDLAMEKPAREDITHVEMSNRESTPHNSSLNQTGHLYSSSPCHPNPPRPMKNGTDSPSAFASNENNNRVQSGERRSYGRHKRADLGFGRGNGGSWKSNSAWPSPVSNGFTPLQHGPPHGFRSAVPQFPAAPFFNVRPTMGLTNSGVSFHMHDLAERFSGPGRPFGWHNSVEQLRPPHMQAWEGSNGMFSDDSRMYGRTDWGPNRHPGGTGWEMGTDLWKEQNINGIMDIPLPKKGLDTRRSLNGELLPVQSDQKSNKEEGTLEGCPSENVKHKRARVQPVAEKSLPSPVKKTLQQFGANYIARVDISPELANQELYEKFAPLLCITETNEARTFNTNLHIQSIKDGNTKKRDNATTLFNSLFPTAKDAVFQKAMYLYKRHNEKSKVWFPVLPVAENVNESTEHSYEKVQRASNESLFNGTASPGANSVDMKALENTTDMGDTACEEQKQDSRSSSDSDTIIEANGHLLAEGCTMNLSRIHDSLESTH